MDALEPMHLMLDRATASAGIGAWQCDLRTEGLAWSSGTYGLFGLSTDAPLVRRNIVTMYAPESRDEMETKRAVAIARQQPFSLDARILLRDGVERWIRICGEVGCHQGASVSIYGVKQDVTEDRRRHEALRRLAEQDPVTGVASRAIFQARFLSPTMEPETAMPLGALVLFDLDGFKALNDAHGHAAGDACLREVASRLRAGFPDATMVARIGGDEFAVLVPPRPAGEVLPARLNTVIAQICQPMVWQGQILRFGASAGAAVTTDARYYDPTELFGIADAALYGAKRQGRNRVIVAGGAASPALAGGHRLRALPQSA